MIKSGKKMIAGYEQVELYSEAEYRRRIGGLQNIMKEKDLDMILFPECAEEAYDQWLTGRRMLSFMIAFADGTVLGCLYSEFDERFLPVSDGIDFSRYRMQKDSFLPAGHIRFMGPLTGRRQAELIADRYVSGIGIVLPDHMSKELAGALKEKLPHARIEDVTIPAAVFRAVKSEEEFAAAAQARKIQVQIYDAMDQMIRPGRTMRDITQEMLYLLRELGSGNIVHAHLIAKGPQDVPFDMEGQKHENRIVQEGDRIFALMEAGGPGGHHLCFGRDMTIGAPIPAWEKAVNDATILHKYAAAMMKPGETLADIARKTRKEANRMGYELKEQIGWNWMHSLGGYYYEQLSLEDYTEDFPILKDMLLHCHPLIYRYFPEKGIYAREELFVLNAYRITEDGPEDLIGLPFGIRQIG